MKVVKISETVDIKQANELTLQQEIEHFKKIFEKESVNKEEEKVRKVSYFNRIYYSKTGT